MCDNRHILRRLSAWMRMHDERRALALASSFKGMDHMVRTFHDMTGQPIWEVVRMASLTPATIAGCDRDLGSLDIGKIADILLLSPTLEINRVFVEGMEIIPSAPLSSIVS